MANNIQNNNHQIDGRVVHITQPKYVSATYTKQILVLEVFRGERRHEVPFTFDNARMDALKSVKEGDWVNVQFQLAGNKGKGEGEARWFNENIALTCIKG
jgi:hypothetical protein